MDSGLIPFIISCKDLPVNSVGFLGLVGNISNVLVKTSAKLLKSFDGWTEFVEQFLEVKNLQEKVVLGHGAFRVDSNLSLPEVDDEFFDAIEGPEDYELPGSQLDQRAVKVEQQGLLLDIESKEDLAQNEKNSNVETKEARIEIEGNSKEEEEKSKM